MWLTKLLSHWEDHHVPISIVVVLSLLVHLIKSIYDLILSSTSNFQNDGITYSRPLLRYYFRQCYFYLTLPRTRLQKVPSVIISNGDGCRTLDDVSITSSTIGYGRRRHNPVLRLLRRIRSSYRTRNVCNNKQSIVITCHRAPPQDGQTAV